MIKIMTIFTPNKKRDRRIFIKKLGVFLSPLVIGALILSTLGIYLSREVGNQQIQIIEKSLAVLAKTDEMVSDRLIELTSLDALRSTPMHRAIPYIDKASEYFRVPVEIFIGISYAESSHKDFKCYNPWGIGNDGPKCFDNWEHSVNEFARLIRYYYLDEGRNTPEKILMKYVAWDNPDWIKNVRAYWNP